MKKWRAAEELLRKGADPNKAARGSDGALVTPLVYAAYKGSYEVCKKLLESGARQDIDTSEENLVDISSLDFNDGMLPFHRRTNGRQPSKTIETDGCLTPKPSKTH